MGDGTGQCSHTGQISSLSDYDEDEENVDYLDRIFLSMEEENKVNAKKLIYDVLQSCPEALVCNLDIDNVLDGYLTFIKECLSRKNYV